MGVDQLAESVREEAQGRQYLRNLVEDLQRTEGSIRSGAALYTQILAHGRAVLSVVTGQKEVPQDTIAFLVSLYEVTRSNEPTVSRATYQDLLSTGSLRLIGSDSVRQTIVDYFESIERTLRPIDYDLDRAPYRTTIRSLIPLDMQLAIRRCLGVDAELCRTYAAGIPLGPVVDSVLASPELGAQLTLSLQSSAIRTFDSAVEYTARVRAAIEREIGGG